MATIRVTGKIGEIRTRDGKVPEVKLSLNFTTQDVLELVAWQDGNATLTVVLEATAEQLAFPEGAGSSALQRLADGAGGGESESLFAAEAGTWVINGDRLPVLHIENDPDPVYRLTGMEIRRLAEPTVPEDEPLWVQEVELVGDDVAQAVYEQPGEWRQVGDTELLEIKADMRFQTGFRSPGADPVDGSLAAPEGDEETDQEREAAAEAAEEAERRESPTRSRRGAFSVVPPSEGVPV